MGLLLARVRERGNWLCCIKCMVCRYQLLERAYNVVHSPVVQHPFVRSGVVPRALSKKVPPRQGRHSHIVAHGPVLPVFPRDDGVDDCLVDWPPPGSTLDRKMRCGMGTIFATRGTVEDQWMVRVQSLKEPSCRAERRRMRGLTNGCLGTTALTVLFESAFELWWRIEVTGDYGRITLHTGGPHTD